MKKLLIMFSAISVMGLLTAMGSLGKSDTDIPKPEKNFSATVVDQLDISTDLEQVSCDGNTFIKGQRGLASIIVDFDTIKQIKLSMDENEKISATIIPKKGDNFEVLLGKNLKCYGMSIFGAYTIKAKNLKKIVFKE